MKERKTLIIHLMPQLRRVAQEIGQSLRVFLCKKHE